MQVFLTTTGTQANTIINDLGKALFVHPKINVPLIEPLGEFTANDVSTSVGLINAVSSGYITLTNIDGSSITSLNNITDKQSDHGNQLGLLDDDHTQYLNNSRGDLRYLSKTLASSNIYVGNNTNEATTVTLSGDATLSNTGALTLNSVSTSGTYKSVTVDVKGRVTSGSNPSTLSGYGITDAQPLDGDLTALSALSTVGFVGRTGVNTYVPRTMTGTLNRILISNGDGVAAAPTFDISSNYVGQSSITTLGTLTTGVWNASIIPIAYGGTGASTNTAAINNLLPSQISNNTKVLTTDGTNVSWVFDNLQTSYNNSTAPQITTSTSLGALNLRRGSAADTDRVLEISNGVGASVFEVDGDGTTKIKRVVGTTNLVVAPSILDPNIATKTPAVYIESTRTGTTEGLRVFHTDGDINFSGYTSFGYNGSSPEFSLLDMDDDPSYITFSIARLGLVNPGTFTAPAIMSRFGGRGTFGAGVTGFSWQSNGGVSGGAFTEIMSCDNNFLAIPSTTTALRSTSPTNGMIAYNSTLGRVDAYQNGAWTQYIDTTTNQTIAGNKIFTGKVQANTEILQYFNSGSVTTTSATFAVITGMTLTTTNTITTTYSVIANLNIRNSTTNATVIEVQIFVNGVADPNTIVNYSSNISSAPTIVPLNKIYIDAAASTVFDVRWRRVSGTATPTVTNKSLIVQEIL